MSDTVIPLTVGLNWASKREMLRGFFPVINGFID